MSRGLGELFKGLRVLVVGDLILDEYLIGRATRLSREAAVPVLERTRREILPGGAANPAVGVVALGGHATLSGVVGEDGPAESLRRLLETRGVGTDGIVADPGRPTTTKTRIVAEGSFIYGQHLARIDHLDRQPLSAALEEEVSERVRALASTHDVLLLSDYKNGVVTPSLVASLRTVREEKGAPLVVDSQGDLERFRGFDLVKCNRAEAEAFLGREVPPGTPESWPEALHYIRERTRAGAVAVTLGGEGMVWLDDTGYGECRAPRADVFDVTGAGDTVIAVLALARAARVPLAGACRLAVHAAALTVRVMGNYAPTWEEVSRAVDAAPPET